MASVRLVSIGKTFRGGHDAVRGLDLEVPDGELLVLVGPSGCGKSTVLRLVAGLETPTEGKVLIGGRDVTGVEPQDRDVAMVFQSYALYPHKTVRANLEFGLRMRGVPPDAMRHRVEETARALEIEPILDRMPSQLSGGQRQRVALGRAIVREPQAFLLDEPLSNLDAALRVQARAELARLHRRLRATVLYVTHDQEEAMTLGDRLAVLRDGRLQQVGPPLEVYRRPANVFVAGFVGSPAINLLPCVPSPSGAARVESRLFSIELPAPLPGAPARTSLLLGVRPQDVEVVGADEGDVGARVEVLEPLGNDALLHLVAGEGSERVPLRTLVPSDRSGLAVDAVVGVRFRRDRLHVFDAQTGERVAPL